MTNEEAVEFGKMWLEINEDCKDSSTYEFFQMAIEALEQEDVLDKIRAEIEGIIQEETVVDNSGGEYERTISKLDSDDVLQIIDKYRAESEG